MDCQGISPGCGRATAAGDRIADMEAKLQTRGLRFSLRTLLVVTAVSACLSALGVTIYNSLPNEATRAEIDQLRPGMTKDEVLAILGKPDYIDQTQIYGEGGERWDYGIWGWGIFFVGDRFVHAELF
jgi:hypothetical protein